MWPQTFLCCVLSELIEHFVLEKEHLFEVITVNCLSAHKLSNYEKQGHYFSNKMFMLSFPLHKTFIWIAFHSKGLFWRWFSFWIANFIIRLLCFKTGTTFGWIQNRTWMYNRTIAMTTDFLPLRKGCWIRPTAWGDFNLWHHLLTLISHVMYEIVHFKVSVNLNCA